MNAEGRDVPAAAGDRRWWSRRTSRGSPASAKASGALPPGRSSTSTTPGCRRRNWRCLRFVLDDLGWDGYLGFVEEGRDNLHIGCSPASRDFFTTVFQEALEATGQPE